MRILEEFWYGNIKPTEYDTSSCTNTDCLIFQNGFKLGARMMLEVMEDTPFNR